MGRAAGGARREEPAEEAMARGASKPRCG
uniref:Uncharacterized protein n=1 Tax=Arundo donax TaxID=35708 RepID=A0A0A9H167_ARUDO